MRAFTLHRGAAPVLISFPHVGTTLPPGLAARLSAAGKSLIDTDWHVDRLYEFAIDMGITTLRASLSRYVVDLNRDPAGARLYASAITTPPCPIETFEGELLYAPGDEPTDAEIAERIEEFWDPYHVQLRTEVDRLRAAHGYAILLDAHSIWGRLPRLFEGELRDINIGTNDGTSCALDVTLQAVFATTPSDYSVVVDDRFKGGYITRHYGVPNENCHALQIELNQRTYLADGSRTEYDAAKAVTLMRTLKDVVAALLAWEPRIGSRNAR